MKPRRVVAALLATWILYLLSVGPVIALKERFGQPALNDLREIEPSEGDKVVSVIYAPVFWLAERSPAGVRLYIWYVSLWEKLVLSVALQVTLQT